MNNKEKSSFNILSLKIDEDFSNLSFDEEFEILYQDIFENQDEKTFLDKQID